MNALQPFFLKMARNWEVLYEQDRRIVDLVHKLETPSLLTLADLKTAYECDDSVGNLLSQAKEITVSSDRLQKVSDRVLELVRLDEEASLIQFALLDDQEFLQMPLIEVRARSHLDVLAARLEEIAAEDPAFFEDLPEQSIGREGMWAIANMNQSSAEVLDFQSSSTCFSTPFNDLLIPIGRAEAEIRRRVQLLSASDVLHIMMRHPEIRKCVIENLSNEQVGALKLTVDIIRLSFPGQVSGDDERSCLNQMEWRVIARRFLPHQIAIIKEMVTPDIKNFLDIVK
jgi:hypothetical protein